MNVGFHIVHYERNKRMNILLLENDDKALEVKPYLEGMGHEVTHAKFLADLQFYIMLEPGFNYYDIFLIENINFFQFYQ